MRRAGLDWLCGGRGSSQPVSAWDAGSAGAERELSERELLLAEVPLGAGGLGQAMEEPRSPALRAEAPRAGGEGKPAAGGRRQSSPDSVSNSRRNERERNRVKMVNLGFSNLQRHVPQGGAGKRMSKVDTLRSAVDYIRRLEVLLREQGPGGKQRPPTSTTGSASASPTSSCGDTSGDSISSEQDFTAYKGWLGIE